MDCKHITELLPAFALDELTDQDKIDVQDHLASCNECSLKLQQTRELLSIIENAEAQEPATDQRQLFMTHLRAEKARELNKGGKVVSFSAISWRIAASIALLIVGYLAGSFSGNDLSSDDELVALKSEVQSMKQLVMQSMLTQETASERIKAVNLVEELDAPSYEVITTLFQTLNEDESPNVRLAALRALEAFTYDDNVKLLLIRSFEFQDNPIVQITLINLMIQLEEKRAAKKFQQLINSDNTEKVVKDQAAIGIQILT